jgi:hypothetical protein
MATAIFDETNRVRRQLGLRLFTPHAKLDEAAALKAVAGVLQSELTHTNPLPDTATPADRVRFVGLTYRLVAENIARLGLLNVPPGVTQIGPAPPRWTRGTLPARHRSRRGPAHLRQLRRPHGE